MRSDITEPVRQYAQGEITIDQALDLLRQVTPAPYETSDPYSNDPVQHEGNFVDLFSACMIYDLTAEEYDHMGRALYATPIGGTPDTTPKFSEVRETLIQQLDPTGDDEDDAIWPDAGAPIVAAQPRVIVDGEEPEEPSEEQEPPEKPDLGTKVKKAKVARLLKHFPGGQDHDQTGHGNWSDGPSTSSSGGEGSTLTQGPGEVAGGGVEGGGAESSPPPTPETEQVRGGGRASRPKYLSDLVGQEKVRERLGIMLDAARAEGRSLDHVLLSGPPGLGKTTIANAIANEMGSNLKVVTGPALRNRQMLQDILLDMNDGDVLFIDEIHALPTAVEELMLPLLEDGEFDATIGDGPDKRIVRVQAPNITILGATTNPEGVVKPLRDRFGAQEHLSYYTTPELQGLVTKTASKYGIELPNDVAASLAERSRGTPRLANRNLRWLRDYVTAGRAASPDMGALNAVMNLHGVDPRGLRSEDRLVMRALQESGGTIGVNALAARIGQDEATIQSVIEPYLMRIGFINRGSGGRSLTQAGLVHLETYGDDDSFEKRLAIEPMFNAPIEIAKRDDRKNLVFGWANVAFNEGGQVEDRQGHLIDVDDLEGAAYNFAVKYRKTGDMHKGDGYGDLVESLVVTQDKIDRGGFPPEMLGKWWVGFRVPDEDWDRVESGERSMFSIQGRARLEPI